MAYTPYVDLVGAQSVAFGTPVKIDPAGVSGTSTIVHWQFGGTATAALQVSADGVTFTSIGSTASGSSVVIFNVAALWLRISTTAWTSGSITARVFLKKPAKVYDATPVG